MRLWDYNFAIFQCHLAMVGVVLFLWIHGSSGSGVHQSGSAKLAAEWLGLARLGLGNPKRAMVQKSFGNVYSINDG